MTLHKRINYNTIIFTIVILFITTQLSARNFQSNKLIPITYKSEKAKEQFDKGLELFNKILENESYKHFEKAAELDSTFALAVAFKGRTHPEFEGKREFITTAFQLSKNLSIGEQLIIEGFYAFYVERNSKNEYNAFKKLVEEYPNDPLARYFWGYTNWRHGRTNYETAEIQLKKTIELDPTLPAAYNDLGYVLSELKKFDEAKAMLAKYIELNPENVNAYDSYAEILFKAGNFHESIEAYKKALQIDPDYFWSNLGLAANYRYSNQIEKSKEIVNTLVTKAKNERELNHVKTIKLITLIYEDKWDEVLNEIEQQYNEAVNQNNFISEYRALSQWGDLLFETQKFVDAIEKYKQAETVILNSKLPENNKRRVKTITAQKIINSNIAANNLTEAKKMLREVESQIEESERKLIKAKILFAKKNYEEALNNINNSEDSFETMFLKAQVFAKMNEIEKAKKLFNKISELNLLNDLHYSIIRKQSLYILNNI